MFLLPTVVARSSKMGTSAVTDKPGIGLELNMENVREHAAPGFGVFE